MIWHDQERARRLLLSRTHKKLIQLHTLSLPRNNLKESGHCQTGRKSQVRLISKSNERPKKKKNLYRSNCFYCLSKVIDKFPTDQIGVKLGIVWSSRRSIAGGIFNFPSCLSSHLFGFLLFFLITR